MNKTNFKVSADSLKWIALITMFIDHIGAGIIEMRYPQLRTLDIVIRCIGRIAFPIFCYQIIEGYEHTRNRWKYALNLLVFLAISEIPFDFLIMERFSWGYQNVYWTLLIGLLAVMAMGFIEEKKLKAGKVLEILAAVGIALLADLLRTDYGAWGVFLIEIIFLTRKMDRRWQCLICSLFLCTHFSEIPGIVAFVLILFYNGERKNKINKYIFYSLYPAHLALYVGIRYLLGLLGV